MSSQLHHVIEQKQSTITLLGWPTDIVCIDYSVNIIHGRGNDEDDNGDDDDYNDNDYVSYPNYDPNNSKSKSKSTTTKSVPVQAIKVHTILIWIPGNPGQHNWYNSDFKEILSVLGQGYAIRSISHAGHNCNSNNNSSSIVNVEEYCRENNEANASIPWTVDGQVLHKIAYIDNLLSKLLIDEDEDETPRQHQQTQKQQHHTHAHQQQQTHRHRQQQKHPRRRSIKPNKISPKFIFVGHSFGCHVIQRMCVLRPDILERTLGFIFLMPYIRTFPNNKIDQRKLNLVGNCNPNHLINIGTTLSQTLQSYIPEWIVRSLIRHGMKSDDDEIINLAAHLVQQPTYPQNFFQLGTEEIRDIPNEIDVNALRILSSISISSTSSSTSSLSLVGDDNDNRNKIRISQRQRQHRYICILYAGDNDQWCPSFHGEEIKNLQSINVLPSSIKLTTMVGGLRHDYVCQNQATRSKVNQWCISNIIRIMNDNDDNYDNNENSNTNNDNESSDNNITTATSTTSTINNHTNVGGNSQSNTAQATTMLVSRL